MAHPHAEVGERCAKRLLTAFPKLAKTLEPDSGAAGIGCVGRDGHQAVKFKSGESVEFGEVTEDLVWMITKFRGLAGHIHLQEDGEGSAGFGCGFVQFRGQAEAVDALDHAEQLDSIPAFVGLEMSDHVPLQMGRAEGDLGPGLLDLVFPEEPDSEAGGGGDRFWRMRLRHGHERDLSRIPVGSFAGGFEPAPDDFQAFSERGGALHGAQDSLNRAPDKPWALRFLGRNGVRPLRWTRSSRQRCRKLVFKTTCVECAPISA